MSRHWAIPLFAATLLTGAAQAIDVPYLTGRVTDNAEILNAETRKVLTEQLAAHERATANQVAVLTVPSMGDASIEEFAVEVFSAWKLGRKGQDNGVLVVVAPNDRRMRIEVGYGLEGTLTDAQASRIIRDFMTPRFKEGDYNRGITDGVRAVIGTLEGDASALPAPTTGSTSPTPAGDSGNDNFFSGPELSWPERILIGGFIFGIIGLFTVVGLFTPGMGWFLYFFLIPFWAMFPIVVIGVTGTLYVLGTYLVGFPIVKLLIGRRDWYKKAAHDLKTKGRAKVGGWTLGGRSSGSSWSSGGSGGGFSGGGGSSGGGGASGSW